ncbi:MAG: DUF1015 domain-containing protein [Deltaproteobacteria bacterium]|nr:DUF1015 domain-containing protein [Deltaproteobacteria bacterium]
MLRIAPFRGVFYNPKKFRDLNKVIAPPYDIISKEEQEKLYKKSPHNFVRLDLSQEPDSYNTVAQLLGEWRSQGILERDETPAIYFLAHRFKLKDGEEKLRHGFFALVQLQDLDTGDIRPHEKTLDAPKEDRLKLMLACQSQLSPIFALYDDAKQSINRLLIIAVEGVAPALEFELDNGEECKLWRITDPAIVEKVQLAMREQTLLIADGHHRYEATLRYRDQMRAERGHFTGNEAFNYIIAYCANMSDDNVAILPTHRLVRGFTHKPFLELEEALQTYFYVEQHPKTPDGKNSFLKALKRAAKKHRVIGASFKRDPRYLILRLKNKRVMQRMAKELSAPLRELDVSTLHLLILEHILALTPEHQVNGETIRYSQDEEAVLQALEKEDYQATFILAATKKEEIQAIVAGGEKMPQKSTYFYPKLSSGLIVNQIDADEQIE